MLCSGELAEASRRYRIPLADWLDLSTGISPFRYPVPPVAREAWRRFPETDDGLCEAAWTYYGTRHLLPVAGADAAAQELPTLRGPSRVVVGAPGCAHTAKVWQRAGHHIAFRRRTDLLNNLKDVDVVILANPGDCNGEQFTVEDLRQLGAALAARGGWLVVDETFMDATPEASLASCAGEAGLVVLRSLDAFFGLAGARVGFVLAEDRLLTALRERCGAWALAGPSREVARAALLDRVWQRAQRQRLLQASAKLAKALTVHHLRPTGGCALFQWCQTNEAETLHTRLARRGIWVLKCDDPTGVRIGLPGDEAGWVRLRNGLWAALH